MTSVIGPRGKCGTVNAPSDRKQVVDCALERSHMYIGDITVKRGWHVVICDRLRDEHGGGGCRRGNEGDQKMLQSHAL